MKTPSNCTKLFSILVGMTALAIVALGAVAPAFAAPQASITLTNCNSELCNANNTEWTLDKTPATQTLTGDNTISWTVDATRGATSDNFITVNGVMTVTNTGSAPATIGNIVVNLQKPRTGPNIGACRNIPWVSAAANVADATFGDGATSANIVAAASQENAACNNSPQGAHDYSVSGAQGTFTETSGSGTLEFTDANSNTVWAISPEQTILPGNSVTLLYTATFDNTVLNLLVNSSVRAEAIVTFGNAGARGGSGASATNIDIDGSGGLSSDEYNVRSVPCRVTKAVPALIAGNDTVALSDESSDVSVTGTSVTVSNFVTDIGAGVGVQDINTNGTFSVMVDEVCTPPGSATVNNTAHLDGASSSVTVQGPQIGQNCTTDPFTLVTTCTPVYAQYTFACVTGVALDASANASVSCEEDPLPLPQLPNACTYTKGGYAGSGDPGQIFDSNFTIVFPTGLIIGIDNVSNPPYDATWTLAGVVHGGQNPVCTGLKCYLHTQGGTPGALTADTLNATSTGGGTLAAQVATLALNIGFDAAGDLPHDIQGFGGLQLCNTDSSLDGQTVQQILGAANIALSGGALPTGYSYGTLNGLVTNLNESFDNCTASAFANTNLCTH